MLPPNLSAITPEVAPQYLHIIESERILTKMPKYVSTLRIDTGAGHSTASPIDCKAITNFINFESRRFWYISIQLDMYRMTPRSLGSDNSKQL